MLINNGVQAGANGASATAATPKPKPAKPAAAPAATKSFTNINRSGSLMPVCKCMFRYTMRLDRQYSNMLTSCHAILPMSRFVAYECRFVVPKHAQQLFIAEWKHREADMEQHPGFEGFQISSDGDSFTVSSR